MDTAPLGRLRGAREPPESAEFRLGEVDVYPASGQLKGPESSRKVDPKVMQVLLRLVAEAGEVVSRETLMADVWGKTVVSDFALSRCIYQLRKNLGRAAGIQDPPIETLPKRGYRLLWPVEDSRIIPAREPRAQWPRKPTAIILLLLTVGAGVWLWAIWPPGGPQRPAIAVLPFADLSPSGDMRYFGDGVATALTTELGRLGEVDVIANSSSFQFRDRRTGVSDIGTALDAEYLVEGSVHSDGDQVRITAALIDAASGRQIWSDTFDGLSGQAFTVQTDIAYQIAGFLEVSVGEPRKYGGTVNLEAFKAYLKAVDEVGDDGGRTSDAWLDEALAHDPDYADALEAKAFLIYLRLWQGDGVAESAWQQARPYLDRALEIAGGSAWAYGTMAGFRLYLEDYEEAEELLQKALEINPSHPWALVHLSRLMSQTGRLQEAVRLAERNARLDPLNPFRHIQLANRYWTAGEFEQGRASFERALELDPLNYAGWRDYALRLSNLEGVAAGFRLLARLQTNPDFRDQFTGPNPTLAPTGVGIIARWLESIGDYELAWEMLDLQSRLGDSAEVHRERGWILLAQGDFDGAEHEAWMALEGMPREEIVSWQVASIALRRDAGLDAVVAHYAEYWPALFREPPDAESVPSLVVLSAALIAARQGRSNRSSRLLRSLVDDDQRSPDARAMALAHLGETHDALAELERHVGYNGHFHYLEGDPFWAPLADDPRFRAIVAAEADRNARARRVLNALLASGDIILPGYEKAPGHQGSLR